MSWDSTVAVDDLGHATVVAGPATPLPVLPGVTGTRAPGGVDGAIDGWQDLDRSGERVLRAKIDPTIAYGWIAFSAPPKEPTSVMVGSAPDIGRRAVTFRLAPGDAAATAVRVGACTQWERRGAWTYLRIEGDYAPTELLVMP